MPQNNKGTNNSAAKGAGTSMPKAAQNGSAAQRKSVEAQGTRRQTPPQARVMPQVADDSNPFANPWIWGGLALAVLVLGVTAFFALNRAEVSPETQAQENILRSLRETTSSDLSQTEREDILRSVRTESPTGSQQSGSGASTQPVPAEPLSTEEREDVLRGLRGL